MLHQNLRETKKTLLMTQGYLRNWIQWYVRKISFNKSRSQLMGASLNSYYVHYEKPGLKSWHKNWATIGNESWGSVRIISSTNSSGKCYYPQHSEILKGRKYPGKMGPLIIMKRMIKPNAKNKMKNLHQKH